jgi:hypothetical protein
VASVVVILEDFLEVQIIMEEDYLEIKITQITYLTIKHKFIQIVLLYLATILLIQVEEVCLEIIAIIILEVCLVIVAIIMEEVVYLEIT